MIERYFRKDIKREIPIFEENDLFSLKELRRGMVFNYKGYEITIAEPTAKDTTPSLITFDLLSGKWIIVLNEDVPLSLVVPILEHEVYEIEHKNHEKAVEIGRIKAEELGVLNNFLEFEYRWRDHNNNLKQ